MTTKRKPIANRTHPPKARYQLDVGQEPLTLTFESDSWEKQTNFKSAYHLKEATDIFKPGPGNLPIKWTEKGYRVCDGVRARLVSRTSENNDYEKRSHEDWELTIEAKACQVYIKVFEEVYSTDKDGEGDSRFDSYWIKVRKAR
jgi:hypothetical protein